MVVRRMPLGWTGRILAGRHFVCQPTMKLSTSALVVVAVSQAAAWAPPQFGRVSLRLQSAIASYSTEVIGEAQTESFRLQFNEADKAVSPWHDIPLSNADGTYNMVSLPCMECASAGRAEMLRVM
jgi:hypothetical protein